MTIHTKKIIFWVVGILIGIYFSLVIIGFVTHYLYPHLQEYLKHRKLTTLIHQLEQAQRDDIYGGKTPEETWRLFFDAIQIRDVNLASKYVFTSKQQETLNFLNNELNIDNLQLFTDQIPSKLEKDTGGRLVSEGKVYYHYLFKDKKSGKTYNNSVIFYLNQYSGVWKLSIL